MYPDMQHRPPLITLSDLLEIAAVLGISVLLVVAMTGAMIFALGEKAPPPGNQNEVGWYAPDRDGVDPEDDPRQRPLP